MRTHTIKQGRIFKDPFLESLTKSSLLITVLFYGSLVILFFYLSYRLTFLGVEETIMCYAVGLMAWTFLEYLLHRYVFHIDKYVAKAKRFHYIVHGVHHDQPADKERLFMPPVPGILIASFL